MKAHQVQYPIATMCRVLEVSTSGYYAWRKRGPSRRAQEDAKLLARIKAIHKKSGATYGVPRIHAELVMAEGFQVGRKRVARLMRYAGIEGVSRRRRRSTTRRDESARPAPDLVDRDFSVEAPDRLWVADIERHEALLNRAVMKGHRHRLVTASRSKLRAARPRKRGRGREAALTKPGRVSTVR